MNKYTLKKVNGDHSILASLLMFSVAIILAGLIMTVIYTTGPENAERLANRTARTMHNDGNRIYNYE